MKNKYVGKRAFLIANGPSLNITPLYLLKDEYTIVFNRFKLMLERLKYIPSFYMVTDGSVCVDNKNEVLWWADKCQGTFVPDIMKGEMAFLRKALNKSNKIMWLFEEPMGFSDFLPFVKPGATVIFEAFQVLKYLGFSEVIVVGNDMNYVIHNNSTILNEIESKGQKTQQIQSNEDDDPNHFDPRYFGKGKVYHQPTNEVINRIFRNLDYVAEVYKKSGVKVLNAGYNSNVESFPKQEFYKALGYTQEKIDSLFEELIISKGFVSLESFLNKVVVYDPSSDNDYEVIAIPLNFADEVIKKRILDYLPIGPYKNYVYLIKRNIIIEKR